MLEPMHPSLEESPAADTASGRRAAATGRPPGRESPDDIEFNIDELIIKSDKVQLLQENVDRIEENFHVTVGLGMSATEDTHQMQWITIQGIPEDRAQAKSYIKALCSPGKDLAFNFPDELHQTLTHPNVLDRLEKQSCTAILFPSCGQAVIQGEDDLAVALAMSAIEDIIQKYGDVNILDVSSPNSSAGEVSGRLDRELRRLSNQNKELYGEEYDMETLTSLPGPVKRTILKQYIDDSRQNSIEEQPKSDAVTTYSRDPEQTIPMRLVGSSSSSAFSESRFVDLHPTNEPTDNDTRQRKPQTEVDLHPMAASSHNNSSLTLSLSLKDNRDAHAFIDLTAEPSTPVVSVGSPNASTTMVGSPVVDLTQQTSTLAESAGTLSLIGEAIKFALNSGYTKQEIEEVQNVYGDILTTAQFLQVLHTNRREKTQKHAVTVSDLEATHVPRPPQDRCAEVAAIAETVTTDSSRSEEELERPVTPSGKQQAYKTHNQGPKMKRGKLSKTPVKQTGKKAQSRKNRRSPSEETAEKMEVVSLTDQTDDPGAKAPSGTHSNAVHNMLQNSPHSRTKMNSGLKEGDSIVLMDYLKLLTQDYDEEDSSDIEEVRKRNTARRKLLKQALELEKKRHHEQQSRDDDGNKLEAKDETDAVENDVLELDGEDWNTASRDGRHRFPRSPVGSPGSGMERGAIGGDAPDGGTKPKKTDVVTIPDISDNVVPRSLDRGGGASRVYPVEEEHVVQLDALDDFSLPPVINVDTADGLINSRAPQRGACINNNSAQHRQTRFSNPNDQRNPAYSQIRPPQKYNHQPQPLLPTPQPCMSTQPAPLMQQHTAATGRTYDEGSKLASKSNLRYIVLDGSNIAMTHGNHQIFSCKGIQICIEYFRRRGHTEITAFVPQWRTHAPRPDYPIRDQHLLEELRKEGVLVFTPARRVPGKNIVCYDDKFVLRLAQETDGVIISNDNYRDLWHEKREWRQIIEDRLLMFSFVGNIFMPPDDPLGRNGPQLDEFLRKSIPDQCIRDQQQQKRQQYDNEKNLYNRPNHTNQGQGSWAIWGRPSQYQGRSIQGQAAWNQKPVTAHNFNQGYPGQSQNNQAQGHFPQNTQGQGQGHFPHNPQGQGQGNFNQNSGGGPRPRPDSATDWLKKKLFVIFSDKEAKIDEMLQRYPTETDINRIIEYMLEDN